MPSTETSPFDSPAVRNHNRVERFRSKLEAACKELARKPEHVYAVRQHKTKPIFERHLNEYRALVRAGASVDGLTEGIEGIVMELDYERLVAERHMAFPTITDALRAEVQAECRANLHQFLAGGEPTDAELDAAIEATDAEALATKRLGWTLRRLRDERRAMRDSLSYRMQA